MVKIKGWEKIGKLDIWDTEKYPKIRLSIERTTMDDWKWNMRINFRGYYAGRGKFFKTKTEAVKYATAYMRANPNG